MSRNEPRIYSFTFGPFQATVFPLPGGAGFTIDLYHSGTTFTHPRFVCTGEEVAALSRLSRAADSLVTDYLARGRPFEEWCAANGVNPFDPDIAA